MTPLLEEGFTNGGIMLMTVEDWVVHEPEHQHVALQFKGLLHFDVVVGLRAELLGLGFRG